MQQAALTNRLQAAPDLIYQLIGAVRRVPKGLASASAFFRVLGFRVLGFRLYRLWSLEL